MPSSSATTPTPAPIATVDFGPAKRSVRNQHIRHRVSDVLSENYSYVYLPPEDPFSTACWHYEKGGRGEPSRHIITLGENLAKNMKEGCDLGDYAKAYARHEAAHSLWTERDLVALQGECNTRKIPFQMLNLFEDARIEDKWREQFEEKFDWAFYENLKAVDGKQEKADRACAALSTMIQTEGEADQWKPLLADVPEAEEVFEQYYRPATQAADARALFPLMEAFIKEYGLPKNLEQNQGGAKGTQGDMSAGLKVAGDKKARAGLKAAEAKAKGEEAAGSEKGARPDGEEGKIPGGIGEKVDLRGRAKGGVLVDLPQGRIDERLVDRLAAIMRDQFRGGISRYKREAPTKRVLVRDYVLGRTKIFRATEREGIRRSRITSILDCSGSMAHGGGGSTEVPIEAGRHLNLALAQLARAGIIEGKLVLTAVGSSRARTQTIDLRNFTVELALRVAAWGEAEGISNAMDRHKGDLTSSHCTIVFTDGNICDDPVDRRRWHQQGVYTLGVYVGDLARCPRLRDWFDAPLCRKSVENLALGMGVMIRSRTIANQARLASGVVIEPAVASTVGGGIGV